MLATMTQIGAAACLAMLIWVMYGYTMAFGDGGNDYISGFGKAFLRYLVRGALGACAILQIVNAVIANGDSRKQSWHDKSVGSVVVRTASLAGATAGGGGYAAESGYGQGGFDQGQGGYGQTSYGAGQQGQPGQEAQPEGKKRNLTLPIIAAVVVLVLAIALCVGAAVELRRRQKSA